MRHRFHFRSVVTLANSQLSVKTAAVVLASSTLVSALLGIFRDRWLNSMYYDTYPAGLDAYTAAFTVPDFLFFLITSGALAVTFIPVFNQRLVSGNKKSAWELSTSLLNLLAIISLVASILIMVFADPLVRYIVAPGLNESAMSIMGVAIGVVFGAVMQLVASIIGLVGLGFDYEFKIHWKNQGFRTVLKMLPTRSIDQGIDYVTGIMNTNLASRMGEQSIRAFQQASSLRGMPVNLIGVAISTAFYPKLTEEAGRGEEESFRNTLRSAISTIVWICLPVSIVAFFIRGYVVFFIKNGGDYKIANVLGALVVAIFTQALYHIVARGYYAKQKLKKPLIISIIAFIVQVACAIGFSMLNFGPEGLAHAMSISALFEVVVLLICENRDMNHQLLNKAFWRSMLKILIAAVLTGFVSYFITKLLPLRATDKSFFNVFPKFCAIVGGSVITYVGIGALLGIDEAKTVVKKIASILFKNVNVK